MKETTSIMRSKSLQLASHFQKEKKNSIMCQAILFFLLDLSKF